jgi:DegV family protein with EDD domain
MTKIAIITDTDSSLPAETAARCGIRQVPITINFPDATYTTGVDIDDRRLFELIDRQNKLPTTAAPTPGAFISAYQEAFQAGADAIICLCVSSKVSATFNSANTACAEFPGKDITVIDSLNLSMGLGFMAMAAAEAAGAGAGKEEVIRMALETGKRTHIYVVLSTLKYLAMGGRVGKLAAGMADTLSIKALLTVRDGSLDLLEKVRTRKKAMERALELAQACAVGKNIQRLALLHVTNLGEAQVFQSQLCAVLPCPQDTLMAELTPGLSVHGGAGAVGVALVTD